MKELYNRKHAMCTLFDSNYIDKALAMYESIEKQSNDFMLFVLCMNDKCFEVLTDLDYKCLQPIKLSDFEYDELLKVKPQRSVGEYCWTCSSSLVWYIINTFNPEYCSYIDSDLLFYDDPFLIVEEMERRHASVQITGHRFNKGEAEKRSRIVGKYCVEFNTFKNDDNGLKLLNIWRNQCLEHCSIDGDGVYWADQKYMDNWIDDYDFAIETTNMGAGVAPWNIRQYTLDSENDKKISLVCNGKKCNLLFYHYQGITYLTKKQARMNAYTNKKDDLELLHKLYIPYLQLVDKYKDMLTEKYGIVSLIKHHPGVAEEKFALSKLFSPKYWKNIISKLLNKKNRTLDVVDF